MATSLQFEPRELGCRCEVCPLGPAGVLRENEWRPVGPELHEGTRVLAVAESPGSEEVQVGRPLVGPSGHEWVDALKATGHRRPDVDLTNVICCKPPGQSGGAWLRMAKQLDRMNKDRRKNGHDPVPHPSTCCRPGLLQLASTYRDIITLGKTATTALTGRHQSIIATRGGPIGVDEDFNVSDIDQAAHRILPMLHPSFIRRSPSWRHVLHADLGKAFRWFSDQLRWTEPEILWRPDAATLQQWLSQHAPFFTCDVETDGIEALTCNLRCIAIAIPDMDETGKAVAASRETTAKAVGISFLSTNGVTRFYDSVTEAQVRAVLIDFFINPRFVKVGHNFNSYDRMVIEHHFGVTPKPVVDTLFPARFRAPDLPKGLKTIGSILTDVDRWETTEKGSKISTGSQDDDELLRYCIIDTVVNARIVVPLIEATAAAGAFRPLPEQLKPRSWPAQQPFNLNEVDHATQDMCVGLHKAGVWVDQETRWALEMEYEASVRQRQKRLAEMVTEAGFGRLDVKAASHDDDPEVGTKFKPGSYDQIRELLYTHWNLGIPPALEARDFYTDSGLPGTGDAVLRAHLASGNLDLLQGAFIRELRLFRRERNKILGTVLYRMRRRRDDPKLGLVWDDGRVRSNWNAHVTSVGRLSSSGPNLQNIGNRKGQGRLKSIFAAPPGRMLVGADLDQAHLRIIANYWKIPLLLECFLEGKDPHNTLAYHVFGSKFKGASGWGPDGFSLYRKPSSGDAKAMRDISKTFRYASIYGASPATIWQVLTSTETDDAKLPYMAMTQREVRVIHQKWMESEPEWGQAWDKMQRAFDQQNHMEEPVFGRRSGSLSDGKLNEVVNFPILAAESSLMRIAEHRVMEAFPFNFAGPGTGMIHQCHDSIAVEVPEAMVEDAAKTIEECMTLELPGWEVPVTAEADFGKTLKDV